MNKKEDVKIAGVVTLYNPTDDDIKNINTYIDDIEDYILWIIPKEKITRTAFLKIKR